MRDIVAVEAFSSSVVRAAMEGFVYAVDSIYTAMRLWIILKNQHLDPN